MRFQITFHGPFRVSTGGAAPGVDATVDLYDPIPATSLKGLMRAAAAELLDTDTVTTIFGGSDNPSPWSWSGVTFDPTTPPVPIRRVRVPIDSTSGTAVEHGLLFAHEAWAAGPGHFDVDQMLRLEPEDCRRQETCLRGVARTITSLGSDRRRGLGWVTIEPESSGPNELNAFVSHVTGGAD